MAAVKTIQFFLKIYYFYFQNKILFWENIILFLGKTGLKILIIQYNQWRILKSKI